MSTTQKMTIKKASDQSGFGMVEVLVSLIILLVGLLGLAGLMVQGMRSEMESYKRVQALILLRDIAGRINANRNVASCYVITTSSANGTPYLGTAATTTTPACTIGTASQQTQAGKDLTAWNALLLGSAESVGAVKTGAMVGARGCISYDATTELINPTTSTAISGTGIYTVATAWQGMGNTFANTTTMCAKDQYGNESQRRVITLTFRIGSLI